MPRCDWVPNRASAFSIWTTTSRRSVSARASCSCACGTWTATTVSKWTRPTPPSPSCARASIALMPTRMPGLAGRWSHGVRNVGSAGHQVASGIEPRTAGLKREAVHFNGSVLFEDEAGCPGEIQVDGFANGKDDRVAIEALDFVGCDRLPAARGVVLSQAGFHDFDRFDGALGIPDHAVRSGQEHKLCSLVFGSPGFFVNGGHVLAFAP